MNEQTVKLFSVHVELAPACPKY